MKVNYLGIVPIISFYFTVWCMFFLFQCGRPAVEDRCREPGCGLPIGGASHNLVKGNTQIGQTE